MYRTAQYRKLYQYIQHIVTLSHIIIMKITSFFDIQHLCWNLFGALDVAIFSSNGAKCGSIEEVSLIANVEIAIVVSDSPICAVAASSTE